MWRGTARHGFDMERTRAILGFREGFGYDTIVAQTDRLHDGVQVVDTVPALGLAVVRAEGSFPIVRAVARERCDGLQFVEPDHTVSVPTPERVGPVPEATDAATDDGGTDTDTDTDTDAADADGDRYADQPTLKRINVPEAVRLVAEEVDRPYISRVAHVDGGIDYTHPELAPTYVAGRDFVADDEAPDPGQQYPNHGTMTGSLFGADPRTSRLTGVTPNAAVFACQAYGTDLGGQSGLVSHITDAIAWATEQGVEVILLVVQPREGSKAMKRAVDHAAEEGVFMTASSGNFGWTDKVAYPARYDAVFGVGASDDGDRAEFSNTGPGLDIYAPGVDVRVVDPSTEGDQIRAVDGTSFSGPIVGAVATLVLAANPSLLGTDVARILRDTADPGPSDHAGIVNAEAAVQQALSEQ